MNHTTKDLTFIALFVAVTIVLSQIVIPIQPVPISLSMIAVYLSGGLLGWKRGMISQIIYLLLGVIGLPVFANFTGGLGILLGPTGGYLFGYIIAVIIVGYLMENTSKKNILIYSLVMLVGLISCYLLGTIWLSYYLKVNFIEGLTYGVLPFVLGDIVKIIIAAILVQRFKELPLFK